jgi:hypothetical protein
VLISGRRPLLDAFAKALLEREVLERADIDRLMDGVPTIDRRPGVPALRVAASSRTDRPAGR